MATLHDRFDPRRNSFDVLRLSFALLVAVDHGIGIRAGSQWRWGLSTLGDFGLDGFFILSGFLVTRSFVTLDSFPRFMWHRFLRIMPGFWVCLLMTTFVVAPLAALAQGMAPDTPFAGEPSALRYLFGNAGLLIVQYDIAGILADSPQGVSFNGALWTLFFEAFCYVIVAVLGVVGVLRRHRLVVPLVVGVLGVLTILQEAGLPVLVNDRVLRLTFVFLLGAAAYLYADKIPMRTDLAVGSAVVFLVSVAAFADYRVLGAAPLAYVFAWFGACFRWPWSMRADLSYGLYIYHWPIMQLLMLTGLGTTATPVFVVSGLATLAPVAVLSWFLIEKPALGHKHSELPDRIADAVYRRPRSRRQRERLPNEGAQCDRSGSESGVSRHAMSSPPVAGDADSEVRSTMQNGDPSEVPLTRIEVLDFVGEAFDQGPADREDLINVAARDGARERLLARLHKLPAGPFDAPEQLWQHLPEVPVDLHTP